MLLIIILLNYVAAWILFLHLNWFEVCNLYHLSQEEPGPENSARIRKYSSELTGDWFKATLVGGLVGWIVAFVALLVRYVILSSKDFVINLMELAKRYKKVKRGYGIKPDQDEVEKETFWGVAMTPPNEASESSSKDGRI